MNNHGYASARDVSALYDRHAARWDALRDQSLFERPWMDRFLRALPAGRCRVLDLGCGTGRPLAAYLMTRGCHVTGIDPAPGLLARARDSFPDQRWLRGDLRRLPRLRPFHGILAWHSLFHLAPQAQVKAFRALRNLSRPGAILLFTSGPRAGTSFGQVAGDPLYHASLHAKGYRAVLRQHGFDTLRHRVRDPECGRATVWLARRR